MTELALAPRDGTRGECLSPRPLILVDVDDVLVLYVSAREKRRLMYYEGWIQRRVSSYGYEQRILIHQKHGTWLRKLAADTGAELAWGTCWNDLANDVLAPLLGFPSLPVAPCFWQDHKKVRTTAIEWTAGHPFVWLDDDCHAEKAVKSRAGSQLHLVVKVDARLGLTEHDVDQARTWLTALP